MRRLMTGLIPALAFVTAVRSVSAQTRTAPSIGDAVKRTPGRVITQPSIPSRGVQVPTSQQCNGNGYGYDSRYDRNAYDPDQNRNGRDDRTGRLLTPAERQQIERERIQRAREENQRNSYGCCVQQNNRGVLGNGNGTGTIDTRRGNGTGSVYGKTGVTGNGRINPNANAQNGCDRYDDRHDDHRKDDHRNDDHRNDSHRNDRDFDRDRRDRDHHDGR